MRILEAMNSLPFNEKLEKLKRAKVETKVLKLLLAGHTNAEIARLRGKPQGTIRKQISNIYKKFGIKSEFPDDPTKRNQLKDLFQKHKPEWVSDGSSATTNEDKDKIDSSSLPSLSTRLVERDDSLIFLATRRLEEIGFDEIFKVTKSSGYIGYRFKNPTEVVYLYRLILCQKQEGLCISIPQYILEPYLLTLKYWIDEEDLSVEEVIAGRFLVLPSKKDIFLESLHHNYWSMREFVGETEGTFFLNELKEFRDYSESYGGYRYFRVCSSISVDEFNPNTLSDSNSYLIVGEDKLFSYTWQICINSSEVLQEFIDHFGNILILDDGIPNTDDDDVIPDTYDTEF